RFLFRASVYKPKRAEKSLRPRRKLRCEQLEDRRTPTTNLILDFDGGFIPNSVPGLSYQAVGGGQTWKGFVAHHSTPAGSENRTEQILQIVAAFRQEYADFDVNRIVGGAGP